MKVSTQHALRQGYYAAVSYMDHQVGVVMNAIETSAFKDNTVVVFFGDHGYVLGEMGQWTKDSNFELALKTPLMIHAPGIAPRVVTDAYTSHIDIFPSVVHYASRGAEELELCPAGKGMLNHKLCTMGTSLHALEHPVMDGVGEVRGFEAAFAQYNHVASGSEENSPCLDGKCTMGYSVVAKVRSGNHDEGGKQYRYTEYVNFNTRGTFAPVWGKEEIISRMLYDHSRDNTLETENVAEDTKYAKVVEHMSQLLRSGPTTEAGWGPWSEEVRKQLG